MEGEHTTSAPSTPPGVPLFGVGGFRNGNERRSSLLGNSCKCFNIESLSLEEGPLPPISCSLRSSSITLARKVRVCVKSIFMFFFFLFIFFFLISNIYKLMHDIYICYYKIGGSGVYRHTDNNICRSGGTNSEPKD